MLSIQRFLKPFNRLPCQSEISCSHVKSKFLIIKAQPSLLTTFFLTSYVKSCHFNIQPVSLPPQSKSPDSISVQKPRTVGPISPHVISLALPPNPSALSHWAVATHWSPCSFLNIPGPCPPQAALAVPSAQKTFLPLAPSITYLKSLLDCHLRKEDFPQCPSATLSPSPNLFFSLNPTTISNNIYILLLFYLATGMISVLYSCCIPRTYDSIWHIV